MPSDSDSRGAQVQRASCPDRPSRARERCRFFVEDVVPKRVLAGVGDRDAFAFATCASLADVAGLHVCFPKPWRVQIDAQDGGAPTRRDGYEGDGDQGQDRQRCADAVLQLGSILQVGGPDQVQGRGGGALDDAVLLMGTAADAYPPEVPSGPPPWVPIVPPLRIGKPGASCRVPHPSRGWLPGVGAALACNALVPDLPLPRRSRIRLYQLLSGTSTR